MLPRTFNLKPLDGSRKVLVEAALAILQVVKNWFRHVVEKWSTRGLQLMLPNMWLRDMQNKGYEHDAKQNVITAAMWDSFFFGVFFWPSKNGRRSVTSFSTTLVVARDANRDVATTFTTSL